MCKWCAEDGRTVLWTLIGIGIGVIAGALDFLFASGLQLCTQLRTAHLWLLAPFLGLAGLLIVTLYRRYGQRAKRGMALVFDLAQGDEQQSELRLIPLLSVSTWLSHLFGGSVGREGVAVQINAVMAQYCSRWIRLPDASRMLTLTGMAAGFGGLFQTPLAATFFALEVITPGRLRLEALAPALSAAFSACLCSGFLGLHHSVFTFDAAFSLRLPLLGKAALLGILFGPVRPGLQRVFGIHETQDGGVDAGSPGAHPAVRRADQLPHPAAASGALCWPGHQFDRHEPGGRRDLLV